MVTCTNYCGLYSLIHFPQRHSSKLPWDFHIRQYYVDVRLERKKEVLDAYHGAVKQADPAKAEKAEPKKAKSAAKKKSSDLEL